MQTVCHRTSLFITRMITQPTTYIISINGTSFSHTLEIDLIPPKITRATQIATMTPAINETVETSLPNRFKTRFPSGLNVLSIMLEIAFV